MLLRFENSNEVYEKIAFLDTYFKYKKFSHKSLVKKLQKASLSLDFCQIYP